ncbi:MAG: DUF502 domain-containing protein [Bacteroidota bacterium]
MENNVETTTPRESLRTKFSRGVVVIVPLVITIWVLNMLFSAVDGIISPLFDQLLGKHIPGLGFISMIIIIFGVGIISRNLIGRAVLKFFERIIFSIPLARSIYSAMKDVFGAFQIGGKGRSFRQVILIEYPRAGLYTIGFVTNEISIQLEGKTDEVVSAYVPNPPNPTSGLMVLIPRRDVRVLDMTVENGLKMVLSGGIVTSPLIKTK